MYFFQNKKKVCIIEFNFTVNLSLDSSTAQCILLFYHVYHLSTNMAAVAELSSLPKFGILFDVCY
jgi:hypothetical protein